MTIYRDRLPIGQPFWMVDTGPSVVVVMLSKNSTYDRILYRKDDNYGRGMINDLYRFIESGDMRPDDNPPKGVLEILQTRLESGQLTYPANRVTNSVFYKIWKHLFSKKGLTSLLLKNVCLGNRPH